MPLGPAVVLIGLVVVAGVVLALAGHLLRAPQRNAADRRDGCWSRDSHQQLSALSRQLNDVLDRSELERSAVHLIARALGATAVRLYALDRQTRRYHYRAGSVTPLSTRRHDPATRAKGEPTTGAADRAPRPDPALTVRLQARSQPVGLLTLGPKRSGRPYSREELAFLDTLTNQLATALENAALYEEIRDLYLASVRSLAATVDAKDRYTHGHSVRVAHYARAIALTLELPAPEIERIELAALLHDIGKIGVPDAILLKPDQLTADEWLVMVRHAQVGADILADHVALTPLATLVRHHHERYDGRGYPSGLTAEAIPIGAAVIAVADTYDTITTDRPYRAALVPEAARAEIVRCAGTQFSPGVVQAFLEAATRVGWQPADPPEQPSSTGGQASPNNVVGATLAPAARSSGRTESAARLQIAAHLQEFHYG